jgi:Na+-translocating ferredoxin:NAD+ oxidoreductase RnfD subunit
MNLIKKFFRPDNRYLAPVLITCILLAGQVSFGLLESFSRTALAILTAIGFEILLSKMATGRMPHLASAYITGISAGILVRSPDYWPYALCAALAITSKYVLRWKGRHLWNPTNFSVVAMLILASDYMSVLSIQWGNATAPLIVVWVLGAIIVYRVKVGHISAVYVTSFVTLAGVRSLITGHPFLAEVAPITGPMYQLFTFFMVTDPKTIVKTRRGQIVVVIMVAVAELVLRLFENVHAPFYALFIVGPTANVIEIWRTSRKKVAQEQYVAAVA